MIQGIFKRFVHDHFFDRHAGSTEMRDVVTFEAPGGPLGKLIDRLVLGRYLERFLVERNSLIKSSAESNDWKDYLPK